MSNTENDLLLAILREDTVAFITKSFRFLNPNAEFKPDWYVRNLAYELIECQAGRRRRMTIAMPPRHGKSTIVSVIFPAWCLGHDPAMRIICASYAQDLAFKLSADFRKILESEWYHEVFPEIAINPAKCSEREVQTTVNGGRFATSVNGTLTGIGGDMLILDDLLKAEDATSAIERESVMNWLRGTALSRLDNKATGITIVVGQRLHPEDPIGQLQASGGWHEVCLPAIAEIDTIHMLARRQGADKYVRRAGEPLDPSREGLDILEEQRALMGAAKFNAQYQQRPEYEHDTAVRWQWFKTYNGITKFDFVFLSLDPATATTSTADWSACLVVGVLGDDNYILDVYRQRVGFNDLLVRLDQLAVGYCADSILIEGGGIGTGLIQELERTGRHAIKTYRPRTDKMSRLYQTLPVIERGHVLLPAQAPWLGDLHQEMSAFPNGRYDDQVDALSQFLLYRQQLVTAADLNRVHLNGSMPLNKYGTLQSQFIGLGSR